jgi:4-hydroxy-tetrahydrodipicolinate synthase
MKHEQFRGTGTAMITPFDQDGNVAYESFAKLIEYNIDNGVDYLVMLGTTGEAATLTADEKERMLDFTVEQVNGRVPIVAGFASNSTKAVVDAINHYHFKGIDAILSTSPYYNKPNQEGIFQHYKEVAKAAPVPVIVYNVPGRTGSNIKADTTIRLAREIENIIGIKEASADLIQCMDIVRQKPDDFLVISGEDPLTLPMTSFGMDGVISVSANVVPGHFSSMVRQALHGNYEEATALHFKILELTKLLFADGSPAGAKCALRHLGYCHDTLRLPLVNVNEEVDRQIQAALAKYQEGVTSNG